MVAVFPPGVAGLFMVALAIAFWLFWEFLVRKRRSMRTWIVDGIVAGSLVLFVALLPLRTHARVASLGLGFIVFVPAIFAGLLICSWWVIRKYRRGLMTTRGAQDAEEVLLPPALEPGRDAFVELGFEEVTTSRLQDGSVYAYLIRAEDGIVAEVVSYPPPLDQTPIFEISSILAGRTGVLATSTYGLGARLWPGELRQVFPGATAQHLLESHISGLDFLRERGIDPDPLRADEILEVKEDMLGRSRAAAAGVSSKVLKAELVRGAHGRHAAVGPLATQGDIAARIDAFYELRARSQPSS